jgi:SAM-dependent methyltransferase
MGAAYPIPEILTRCSWIDLEPSSRQQRSSRQNLERLTFADASFDIVITSDVMELVRLEERAHREIRRILRPGGFYIFTVPQMRNRETVVRVRITDPDDPSKDDHLLEPDYRGDPTAPGGRALAYRHFGIDLDRRLEELGFEVSYQRTDFEWFGILGTELFLCRVRG